jgi:hypothetical protein
LALAFRYRTSLTISKVANLLKIFLTLSPTVKREQAIAVTVAGKLKMLETRL